MSFIKQISPDEAEGDLAYVYDRIADARGKVANIMSVQSLQPKALEAHLDFYLALMFGRTGLTRGEREMIAVVVSALNRCPYCVRHHAEPLRHFWRDDARVDALVEDWHTIDPSPSERAILYYVEKLTVDSVSIDELDIQPLRDAGISDEDILAINMIASYYNFVNRVANGLGVTFDEGEVQGYKA